jgi:Tol biopolymer transport system component
MPMMLIPALLAATIPATSLAQPEAEEARFLTNPVQLTFADDFVKAGESYFSSDGRLIVFQGVPVPPEGEEPSPHYGMYVSGYEDGRLGAPLRVSAPDSANTCGWFHPESKLAYRIVFGSTRRPPSEENQPGYQRGSGRYRWAFPSEMDIVETSVGTLLGDDPPQTLGEGTAAVFERPGYTAECSYSPDGRFILYAQVDESKSNVIGRPDADLWVFDSHTRTHTLLVEADGYDGGPFFSPDGTWICYRSDRRGDNLLQLFVAELAFNGHGAITGISREIQLTNNEHVNWAPFWHPSGDFLVYATSEVSHQNYEVFAIGFDAKQPEKRSTPVRITHAEGFDGLPAFNSDGTRMLWTAQRGADRGPDGRASSQLWIAEFDADAVREALAKR